MTFKSVFVVLAAAGLGATAFCPSSVSAAPSVGLIAHHNSDIVQLVGDDRRDEDDDGTYVRAPFASVDDDDEGTRVDAPFTSVQTDRRGTYVRAPFVDLWIPRDK